MNIMILGIVRFNYWPRWNIVSINRLQIIIICYIVSFTTLGMFS